MISDTIFLPEIGSAGSDGFGRALPPQGVSLICGSSPSLGFL